MLYLHFRVSLQENVSDLTIRNLSDKNSIINRYLAESEPKDDGSAWYSAEDEAYMVPLNEGLKVPEQCLNRYAYITSYNAGTRNPN